MPPSLPAVSGRRAARCAYTADPATAVQGPVANHIDKQPGPWGHWEHREGTRAQQFAVPEFAENRESLQRVPLPDQEEHQIRVEVYQGDVKIRRKLLRPNGTPAPRKGGGQRGRITGLSPNAARRLRFTLTNVRGLHHVLHLTHPEHYLRDGAVVKQQWKLMREWLVRQRQGGAWSGWPRISWSWRSRRGRASGALEATVPPRPPG